LLSPIFLCIFAADPTIAQQLREHLGGDRFQAHFVSAISALEETIQQSLDQIDCLIVEQDAQIPPLFNQWYEQNRLLPTVIIGEGAAPSHAATYAYHSAELYLPAVELAQITPTIDQAIARFLSLGPSCLLHPHQSPLPAIAPVEAEPNLLLSQQRRLAEKLNERLGYLGVYYKRNPQYFYRNFLPDDRVKFKAQLTDDYREIILNYFSQEAAANALIDQFVNQVFFADLSTSQILEIHMELMDQFAQHLKVEGRSDDILLDYRLTLIDILAHLGEMYRRSIPREDLR
jgi:circadian clock protein KaiA